MKSVQKKNNFILTAQATLKEFQVYFGNVFHKHKVNSTLNMTVFNKFSC